VSSQNVLAEMLGLNPRTISTPIKQIRRLLQEHGITLTPTTLCFDTGRQIEDFLHTDTPVTARQQLTHALADPHLTGMSRTDLNQLIDRLSLQQAALIEKRRHRQRGGPRQPGTRGGVFRQKITDAERMLAAVLYERKLATRHVLAAAFDVSLSTLNNALADALPILREGTTTFAPATSRFENAEQLLESIGIRQLHADTPTT
jgi:DNA-binding transcriptional regulator YhcF (GntR family)